MADWPVEWDYPRVLLVALAEVTAVALLVVARTSTAAFGTYNPAWDGASELRDLARDTGAEATVAPDLEPYGAADPDETVAVVFAPDEPYTDEEAAELRSFLERGGTLVVADDFGSTGNALLADLGAESRIDGTLLRDERHYDRSPALPRATNVSAHALTADLTPEFFGTAMRTQTFAHLSVVGLAAIGVAGIAYSDDRWFSGWPRPGLATLLLAALIVTAPIAYVDLDTLAFPSTTTETEFQAATFAAEHVEGAWTSDHVLTRIDTHYYDGRSSIGPAAAWLGGGPAPDCALLSAASWSTTGAHLFPAGPRTVTPDEYQQLLNERQLVYSSGGGYDSFAVSLPLDSTPGC